MHLVVHLVLFAISIQSLSTINYEESSPPERVESINKCDDRPLPKKKIVCYYRVEDEFRPYDVDPCLCSHVIYSFVAIRDNFAFIAGKKGDLRFLTALKQQNPGLKILVSLRPSNNQFILRETERTNSTSLEVRTRFGKRVREFVRRHGLDGVDLDWEYFKEADDHISKRETLNSLLNILSNELKPFNETSDENHNLLTITTSKFARDLTDYYDFSEIYRSVDFVNVPAFDFDINPTSVKHPSRLHGVTDLENMDSLIDLILALGLPQDQLVVGVPAHGTLLKLANISQTEPGSPASAWGAGELVISHSKICSVRDSANWTLVRDKDLTAPYIYNREKWIGFDDEISIKLKAKYVALRQLSGLALWHLNDDDHSGQCGYGPFPLLKTIRSVFLQSVDNINYNNSIDTIPQTNDNSFVAVIEKYGNVERITESEDSSLLCPHSGYMRHPNDCTKFYRCVQFNKNDGNPEIFQYSCPIGLVFDDRYELCNWPSWSPPCHGSGEIVSTSKKRFVCPSYGYFQDPENCEYFYYCSDFGKIYLQPYQMKCPFDLAFDEEKLLCNWKWLVKGCGPVDPADQVIKDLPQLLNQNAGIEPLAEESSDRFMERSDYIDVDTTNNGNQNSKPIPDKNQGSRFKKISQYMTKLVGVVGDLGSRIKAIFSNTKIESRSDRPARSGNRWLTRVNNYMPKFNKKKHNTEANRQRLQPLMPFMSDPLVSIPILEIRPEKHQLRNIQSKGKPQSQRKPPMSSSPAPKRNRYPSHHLPLTGLSGLHDDLIHISSISKTVQKIQEMIPLRSTKQRDKSITKDPMTPMTSNVKVTKLVHTSTASTAKPSRRPQKGSTTKTRFRPKFHFPTVEPLMIETVEEIELPHYLPQQISLQSIPPPKKSNVRNQQQTYLGGINSFKETLHFTPEELGLDKIKVERKVTPKPDSKPEESRDEEKVLKQLTLNGKNVNPMEIKFHNIDTKLLDTLKYTLQETDKQNEFQTIHLAKSPNKEIKVSVNKELKPTVPQKHSSDEGLSRNRFNQKPNLNVRPHEYNVQPLSRDKVMSPYQTSKGKDRNRLPVNTIHLGHTIQHINQYLPDAEEILKSSQQQLRPLSQQPNPSPNRPINQPTQQKFISPPNHHNVHNVHNVQPISIKSQHWSHGAQPSIQSSINIEDKPQENLPNIPDFESQKIIENENSHPGSPVPPYTRDPLPLKQSFDTEYNRYFDKPFEQLDASATIHEQYPSYHLLSPKPTLDKFSANTINLAQDLRNKNRGKQTIGGLSQKEPEKTQLLIVPVSDHTNANKYTNLEKVNKEYPNLFSEDMITESKKEIKSGLKTTARPRVIFTAPSVSPSPVPSLSDEYIMLMMNNEQNLMNNTDRQKSIHEIFKKTDGKLYNLETDTSKTLVALVPKTPTTPKPVLYESIPNLVSFNVTQPPVVIKFEIPRPKSHVFQNIVQKVRNEWLYSPNGQSSYQSSYQSPYPQTQYHVIEHNYPPTQYSPAQDYVTPQSFMPITYHTTSSPVQEVPQFQDQANLPSIYDSLQQILQQSHWAQSPTPSTEDTVPTETTTPMPTTTTTTTTTTQTTPQSSVILEHIPLYNPPNNHTNGMTWPQNSLPWYQQVVPPYPVPVDPYQPYPQIPPMPPNYPYYPIQSGYGYRSPPNIQPPVHSFQPQFLSPNLTSNNWYDFYDDEQRESSTEEPTTTTTTTTTTSTTTTTTTTTTPSTTETIIVTLPSSQRPVPRVRNRPSFANRRTTTRKPKTTTQIKEEINVEVSTENSYDIRRENSNKEKQKIEVIIVDDNQRQEHTPRRPDLSDPTDVKVVYIDRSKEEPKQTQYSNINPHEDDETYGLRTGVKPVFRDHHKPNRNEYQMQPELPQPPKYEPSPTLSEPIVPKVEHHINKDVEYEDEPEVGHVIKEEMKSSSLAGNTRVEKPETNHNPNPYPGVRNLTDNSVPESACTRPGLFQHPFDCNKYYECYWDKYINKFTLHSFECAVKLAFDSRIVGCGLPSDPTICVQY